MTPFIYKTVYASGLSEIRTFEQLIVRISNTKTVWNPNKIVRISDVFSTEQIVQPNRSDLSEIRTVRISDVDCIFSPAFLPKIYVQISNVWFNRQWLELGEKLNVPKPN